MIQLIVAYTKENGLLLYETNNDELSDNSSTELSHPDKQLPNIQIFDNNLGLGYPIAHDSLMTNTMTNVFVIVVITANKKWVAYA